MDIAEFLTARWDEEEAVVRWMISAQGPWERNGIQIDTRGGNHVATAVWAENAEHIALHDPAHVLADLEAKRAILAHNEAWDNACMDTAMGDSIPRLLSQVYREHPDFDPTWA